MKEVMDIVLGIITLAYMVLGVYGLKEQYQEKNYMGFVAVMAIMIASGYVAFKLLTHSALPWAPHCNRSDFRLD